MTFIKWMLSGVNGGVFLSALVHVGLGGGLYYTLTVPSTPPIVAELDLSMVSLLPSSPPPPAAGSGLSSAAAEPAPGPVRLTAKMRSAPSERETPPTPDLPPSVISEKLEVPEVPETPSMEDGASTSGAVQETDRSGPAVGGTGPVVAEGSGEPGGVPEGQPGGVPGGRPGGVPGGFPSGVGRYLSASEVARPPRWVGNLIGPGDYPRTARRRGKDGKVLLSVFIDEAGRVRDVRLLQGSDDILNEVALRKVREALFTPAYDAGGRPVACKVQLPIRFALE